MTDAQASLNFASMLDEVASGETVLVTRDGVPVARITPERSSAADRVAEVMEKYPVDPDFGDDLERAIRDTRELMRNDGPRRWLWVDE